MIKLNVEYTVEQEITWEDVEMLGEIIETSISTKYKLGKEKYIINKKRNRIGNTIVKFDKYED